MSGDFPGAVEKHASERPGHAAFVFAGQTITYAELHEQVNRVANSLLEAGLCRGDHLVTLLPQCLPFAVLYLATGRIGLVLVPLDPRLTSIEMKSLCDRIKPKVLVTLASPDAIRSAVQSLVDSYRFEQVFYWFGKSVHESSRPYETLLAAGSAPVPANLRPELDDPWIIVFTSGTTGRPKGAMLSHRNAWALAEATARQWEITPSDISLCNMPTSHVAGTHNQLAVQLCAGATGILVPKFDPVQTLELLGQYSVTYFGGVPTMFRLMFRRCNALDYDTRSVRLVVTAGEPASAELIREIAAAFPGAVVASSWGMTETSGFFTFTSLDDGTEIVAETEGRPDPAFEMKILAPDGQALATGAVGELTVRGPSVMRSYMDPSDNAGVISDGWLRTGDLGYLDEAGYLHFAGRSKEMYISGGYNVYPLEIESYLNAYPGVNTSAVIAVPHEVWGEAGVAFVVPEDDAVLTAADLENYCREGLASYKRPGKICVAQNLPMSLIGKIAKRQLRESLAQYLYPDT